MVTEWWSQPLLQTGNLLLLQGFQLKMKSLLVSFPVCSRILLALCLLKNPLIYPIQVSIAIAFAGLIANSPTVGSWGGMVTEWWSQPLLQTRFATPAGLPTENDISPCMFEHPSYSLSVARSLIYPIQV